MNVLAIINTVIDSVKTVESLAISPDANGVVSKPTSVEKLDAAIAIITAIEGQVVPILPQLTALIAFLAGKFFKKTA